MCMQCIIAMLYSGCVDVADFIKCITACRLHFPEGEKKRKIHPSIPTGLFLFCFLLFYPFVFVNCQKTLRSG